MSPRYTPSFGTFHYAYPLFGTRIRAFMPPQGLLVVAAYLPESWDVRFVDDRRDFDAVNEVDARRRAGGRGGRTARQRVVIGDRQDVDAGC